LAFTQAFGAYLALVVEYGFGLSATRQVAQVRDSISRRAELFASVTGAKTVLAVLALGLALVVGRWIPSFQGHPLMLWAGVFWALATAFSPLWYFQGLERMRLVALLDVGAKTLSLFLIVLLVKAPWDGWKVLVIQGSASLFSTLVAFSLVYQEVPVRFPRLHGIWEALRTGWSMFFFRGAVSLYTMGNTVILGLFAPPQIVGYYAGAEKITKAFLGLVGPLNQALYPRLSRLVKEAPAEAARVTLIVMRVMGFLGVGLGAMVWVFAPFLVLVFLGSSYEPAIGVMRILSLLLPVISLNFAMHTQWMLPLGLDRPFNFIIVASGLLNVTLGVLLVHYWLAEGMAWAVVFSEAFACLATWLYLRKVKLDPYSLRSGLVERRGESQP